MTATPIHNRARRSADIVFGAILRAAAEDERADRPFIRMVGEAWRTYRDVYDASMLWAGRLASLGVRSGDRVAVMVPTSLWSIELWGANSMLGAIEVPVHNELRGSMLAHVLNDSGAGVLVVTDSFLAQVEPVLDELRTVRSIVVVGGDRDEPVAVGNWSGEVHHEAALDAGSAATMALVEYWDPSAIIYTSGTTGPAKGVVIPWGQWAMGIEGIFPDVGPDDTFYTPLPLHHIAGRGTVYRSAVSGGRVVLRQRFSVADYWADIGENGCTATILMGAMADMLWREPRHDDDADNPLRTILMTPLIPEAPAFAERFGVRLRTNFGMTEVGATMVGGIDAPLVDTASCGTARRGYDCRVVDEHDEEVPHGEVGELVVRTARPWVIMSGYWNDPVKTAASWRNQWFHTGDAFRRDEAGNFYFVDRVKDAIRRRGENISSFHLELELLAHPDVAECAVVGVPSPETDEEVRAFVVPAEGRSPLPSELVEFLRPRVARFMVPRYWTFADELPRTPTLRVRKGELRAVPLDERTWDRYAP
jgi:crotonobetaine/carnitine-CoA ligase